MAYNTDAASVHRARHAVGQLTELGVPLPRTLGEAVEHLDKIEAFKPPPLPSLSDAIAACADVDELRTLALAELAAPLIRDARGKALIAAADAVMGAIRRNAEEIHAGLGKLAETAIERLKQVAAVGGIALEHLVRAGRHADAELIASSAATERNLEALYVFRERLLWPRGRYPSAGVTRWTDPEYAGCGFVDGLVRGGKLWFPTFSQAVEQATKMQERQRDHDRAVLAGTV